MGLFRKRSREEREEEGNLLALYDEMKAIVGSVREARLSGSDEIFLRALRSAVENAPRIVEDVRNLPETMSDKRWLKARRCCEDGFELYISGCRHTIRWLETGDEVELGEGMKEVNVAADLVNEARHLLGR